MSENKLTLHGRTAIITGAASGIGFAVAQCFAQAGANVVLSDINAQQANFRAEELRNSNYRVAAFPADASQEADMQKLIEFAVRKFATVDVFVNNAGMQYVSSLENFPVAKFEQMIRLMLIGPFISTKTVFPIMKKNGYGRIINMASVNGLIGFAGKAAYNSAKHGVIGLTKVSALEGASHGITVNALCPGYVDTPLVRNQLADIARSRGVPEEKVLEEVIYPLVPQQRLLTVEEVANYALFLASDLGRSITGQAVVMDGGYLAQ
ncbi:3-hydroxybutyrate dehydrogenase [Alicyclobacillus fastidiosus]|uniref:3-hydroxybutyrate dehydrogenase n=1 Tax=Alicyclobacillus fastidiosus TaxID=392011 RepID=A0ABY6ZKK3_9BACL|nr:3-hydroxybutyrate dehydrogenase [Alicyclobacillus fastidiosus]WAH43412.1 3-hydroxybutyrate dehydrogenase [Alicyclobacillus fastidiosus]GMA65485.1 3-hydroxybutyrate dehydrogenase [Alicyclobacillus fastidiosus]